MNNLSENERYLLDYGICSSYFRTKLEEEFKSNPRAIQVSEKQNREYLFEFMKKQHYPKLLEMNTCIKSKRLIDEIIRRKKSINLDIDIYSKLFETAENQLVDFFDGKKTIIGIKTHFLIDLIDFFSIPFAFFKKTIIEENNRIISNKVLFQTQTDHFKTATKRKNVVKFDKNKLNKTLNDVKEMLEKRNRLDLF